MNPEYKKLENKIQWEQKKGNWKRANELRKLYVKYPSGMQNDPDFRRLWYVRYADDTLQGNDLIRHIAGQCAIQVGEAANGRTIDQFVSDFPLIAALVAAH